MTLEVYNPTLWSPNAPKTPPGGALSPKTPIKGEHIFSEEGGISKRGGEVRRRGASVFFDRNIFESFGIKKNSPAAGHSYFISYVLPIFHHIYMGKLL